MLPTLIALVPVVSAEFDKCARPSGVWVGYDQGYGRSRGYAVTYNGGNVYVAGYAIGNLSFHSMHNDGKYADHEGTSTVHDSYTDVTVHHDAGTFTDPKYYKDPAGTQHGMDSTIYKINADGVPQSVFAANTETFDGVYAGDGSSINGAWSGYSQFNALDGFDAEGDMIAGAGYFRGNLSFPMNDGSTKTLFHTHQGSNFYGFVCKVNMAANKAMWVTDVGMRDNFVYVRSAATTAAGHVLVSGNIKNGAGFINLYNGADGASVWSESPVSDTSMISSVDAVDEIAYVSGLFSGSAVDLFAAGSSLTSSSSGSGKDSFVAALDVGSSGSGPQASWVVQIGGSSGYPSVTVSGDYVYVAGSLSAASNISTCSLTAARGGYLAKLERATGACAWAKDVPASRHVVSDGTHVWTVQTSTEKLTFDDDHVLDNIGIEKDVFMAKYQASDGAGLWATVIGGTGDEEGDAAAITPSGPIFTGSSQSEAISVGDLTIRNLHHQQAEARAGFDPETSHAQNAGQRALYVVQMGADVIPSCIGSCPSGELSDATISAGHCYAHGVCVADGAFSDAHFPAMSCLRCDAATNQLALNPTPDTTSHCYFDDICHPSGERATGTTWRNEASLCQWCDPAVNIGAYTLRTGYAHHDAVAKTHFGAVSFGMVFGDWANGCQILPDVALPANKQSALTTALVNPTSAAVTDIGGRTSNAITAVKVGTNANQGIEEAYAWYHADTATCTTVSSGTCRHTPAELADTLGGAFGTATTNGISISRIKVQQGLVLLQEQHNTPSAIVAQHVANLTVDVVAHMLIPYYQGAIRSAHDVDMATDNAQRNVAKARGAEYLKVIVDELNDAFSAADRAGLNAIFSDDFTMTSSHYCAVRDRLLRNLPAVSTLQYGEERPAGSHATGTLVASATDDGKIVHLTSTDVGTLTAAAGVVCPPPSRYPLTYTDCGVSHTIAKAPMKVVTMNQGVTEFMLAMGLQDHMAGTAYLDDSIWPRYAKEYNAIPVLSDSYPTDAQIMAVNADFIMANYNSAFSEKPRSNTSDSGVWTNATVGPCEGVNSDFFPAGSNETMSYGRCRPQLHAINIGTWQERTYCEDTALRPATATEDTVYEAVTQLGDIFDVPHVATQLISEIRNDFAIAAQTVQSSGHQLTAILLDCIDCCDDPEEVFVGAGQGSVNLVLNSSGLTNLMGHKEGSYACVNVADIIAAKPDVLVIVEASWDSAISKIDYMHNRSDFCGARFVKRADYIKIPFSASALGPRNGAAALDLVSAAIHVTTGATTMNFESGVEFFDPYLLVNQTANLLCPLALTDIAYSGIPPSPVSTDDDKLPGWGIAIIVIALVLFFAVLLFAIKMYRAEKRGKPIFVSANDIEVRQVANAKAETQA